METVATTQNKFDEGSVYKKPFLCSHSMPSFILLPLASHVSLPGPGSFALCLCCRS